MITTTIFLDSTLASWTLLSNLFDSLFALLDQIILDPHSVVVIFAGLPIVRFAIAVCATSKFALEAGHDGSLAVVDLTAFAQRSDAPAEFWNGAESCASGQTVVSA